jgi:hypothetical protein
MYILSNQSSKKLLCIYDYVLSHAEEKNIPYLVKKGMEVSKHKRHSKSWIEVKFITHLYLKRYFFMISSRIALSAVANFNMIAWF